MIADGLIQKVTTEHEFKFNFNSPEKLPPPVLAFDNVAFAYSGNMVNCINQLNLTCLLERCIIFKSRISNRYGFPYRSRRSQWSWEIYTS